MRGLIGRKVGMTQVFTDEGERFAVTVIDVKDNVVIQKKLAQGKDGYNAVKLGYDTADKQEKSGMVRYRGATLPEAGVFLKAGIEAPRRHVREFRLTSTELDEYQVGQAVAPGQLFGEGDYVDVVGDSKGRGFTGVIKRHGFSMARATHGTHEYFRHGGAIGQSAWPAKVWKGMKMPGRHGGKRVTVQNLRVFEVLPDEGLLLIRGGVPGANGSIVTVSHAIKRRRALAPQA